MDRWIERIRSRYAGQQAAWIAMPDDAEQPDGAREPAAATAPAADNGSSRSAATGTPDSASAGAPGGISAEEVESLRGQLIQMYEKVGLPADMGAGLPPSGIVEMARMRGILPAEPTPESET